MNGLPFIELTPEDGATLRHLMFNILDLVFKNDRISMQSCTYDGVIACPLDSVGNAIVRRLGKWSTLRKVTDPKSSNPFHKDLNNFSASSYGSNTSSKGDILD